MAILTVILGHFAPFLSINMGRLGVELFFVLSGRLMAEILFERRVEIGPFLFRRVSRIYPVLIVYVAVCAIALIAAKRVDQLPQALAAATLTFNYYQIYVEGVSGPGYLLAHIWSLCIEEHMYLVLAALAFISRRSSVQVSVVISLLALVFIAHGAWRTWEGQDYYAVYWRSDVRGASILLGALMYLHRGWLARYFHVAPVVLVAAGLLLNFEIVPDPLKYSLGTLAFAIGLNRVSVGEPTLSRVLSIPALVSVGLWSYSLYLWQQPLFLANNWVIKSGYTPWLSLLLVGCVFAAGFASFVVVEKPLRRWLNNWQANRRVSRPPSEGATEGVPGDG